MPSINSIPAMAVAIVATALISISGTIGLMQWAIVIPAADPPTPLHKLVTDVSNRLDGRITETLGTAIVCVEEIQALKRERTPSKVPAPAFKKAGG
jgi:hypothetical protein